MQLLGCICEKSVISSDLFLLLNEKSMRDEDFDEVTELRRDLGNILRKLSKRCGSSVLTFMN